jgi:hypothetical protein
MQNFWQKRSYSPFCILASRGKKKKTPKWASRGFMTTVNSTFWMKLDMTLKILVFCISSLQSSWHFVFWILWGTKHPLCFLFVIKFRFPFICWTNIRIARFFIRIILWNIIKNPVFYLCCPVPNNI